MRCVGRRRGPGSRRRRGRRGRRVLVGVWEWGCRMVLGQAAVDGWKLVWRRWLWSLWCGLLYRFVISVSHRLLPL